MDPLTGAVVAAVLFWILKEVVAIAIIFICATIGGVLNYAFTRKFDTGAAIGGIIGWILAIVWTVVAVVQTVIQIVNIFQLAG